MSYYILPDGSKCHKGPLCQRHALLFANSSQMISKVETQVVSGIGERHSHAFKREKEIIDFYSLMVPKNHSYTASYDAYTKINNIPVSIKSPSKNAVNVEFGSYKSHSFVSENFCIILSQWERDNAGLYLYDNPVIFQVDKEKWNALFVPSMSLVVDKVFEGISNSRDDDEKWKQRKNAFSLKYQEEFEKYKNINKLLSNEEKPPVKIFLKRDHKNQKRVQFGLPISKMKQFFPIVEKLDKI